jgi:hypothetical protein
MDGKLFRFASEKGLKRRSPAGGSGGDSGMLKEESQG